MPLSTSRGAHLLFMGDAMVKDDALSRPPGPRPSELRVNGTVLLVDDRAIPLSRQEARIMGVLASRWGRCLPKSALFNALYGDDPDGGPMDADGVLAVRVTRLRKRFEEHDLNLAILTHHGVGYELRRRDA